mgnify:CR=1 FL=1|jgi:hypothetical protein
MNQNVITNALMKEAKDIGEFSEFYSVTQYGDIISKRRNKIMSQRTHKNGYKEIELTINKKRVVRYIHRIVAAAFIGSIKKMQINHKDGDKTNNNVNNLEIVTARENQRHAINNGLFRDTQKRGINGKFLSNASLKDN